MAVPLEVGFDLPQDPAVTTLGHVPNGVHNMLQRHLLIYIAILIIIVRNWKQPECLSPDEGKKKIWYVYRMEYYSAQNKNNNNLKSQNLKLN